jgi:hypothetical protein
VLSAHIENLLGDFLPSETQHIRGFDFLERGCGNNHAVSFPVFLGAHSITGDNGSFREYNQMIVLCKRRRGVCKKRGL